MNSPRHEAQPVEGSREEQDRVGPYRMLRVLGEGGMGVVYLAEQVEGVKRRVALKVMKPGMDTSEFVGRFETERQALAVMDHPNIAKVYDAGATRAGRLYYVMELVQGVPLTDYCGRHRLTVPQRLELFMQVCHAVQHAHQKGVIHRDLKPSNVLVTLIQDLPTPKVIDFGIAKAVGLRLTERTVATEHGQVLGTPAYMSPEQAETSGLDIDTRADIYSLGAMLYELLVDTLPFDAAVNSPLATLAQILRAEFPPPSSRFAGLGAQRAMIAARRRTDVRSLRRHLQTDLDWITMKAMAKDRAFRYETAGALALDVRRHLDQEPVLAGPPSVGYRMAKFVRRHKAGVSAGAAMLALVVGSSVVVSLQAVRLADARDRAQRETAKVKAVNAFVENTLLAPDPLDGLGRDVTVVQALDRAATGLPGALAGEPEIEAAVRHTIGVAYYKLGRYQDAEPLLQAALRTRRALAGNGQEDVAESLYRLGSLRRATGDYGAADTLLRQALEIRRRLLGPLHPDVAATLVGMGMLAIETGRYEDAEPALREALAIREREDSNGLQVAEVLGELGTMYWNQGRYGLAEPLWRRALALRRARLGDHPLVAEMVNNLAVLLDNEGDYAGAEPAYREALMLTRKLLGERHEQVGDILGNLAVLMDNTKRDAEAESLYAEALAVHRSQLGNSHPAVANDLINLGGFLCERGRARTGASLVAQGVAAFRRALDAGDWRIAQARSLHGGCLTALRDYPRAERELLAAERDLERALGDDNLRTRRVRVRLAELYEAWGRLDAARRYRALATP